MRANALVTGKNIFKHAKIETKNSHIDLDILCAYAIFREKPTIFMSCGKKFKKMSHAKLF
jgi:hypothetical protein